LKLIAFQRHSLELAGRVDVCAVVSANLLSAAASTYCSLAVYGCKIVFWRLQTPIHTPSSTIELRQLYEFNAKTFFVKRSLLFPLNNY
jgi:hypothetical protein